MKTLIKIITTTLIVSSVFVIPKTSTQAVTGNAPKNPAETKDNSVEGNCYCSNLSSPDTILDECSPNTSNINCWNKQTKDTLCFISSIHKNDCKNANNKIQAQEQKGECNCRVAGVPAPQILQDATPSSCTSFKKELTDKFNKTTTCKLRYLKPSEGKGNCYCIENKEPYKPTNQCFNNITIEECHKKSNSAQTCFLDPSRLTLCENQAVQASALITKGECECTKDGQTKPTEYDNHTAQECATRQAQTEKQFPNQNASCTLTPGHLNKCTCVLFDKDILFDDFTHTSVQALSPAICNSKSVTDKSFEYKNDKWNAMCIWGTADINKLKSTLKQALDNNANNQDIQQIAAQVNAPQFFPAPELNVPIPGMKKLEPLDLNDTEKKGLELAWIPQYISAIYIFGVGLTTIIATITILIGGIYILTAGGQSGRVSTGQDLIKRSIIGLVLSMGSYFVLYTLNPEITTLKILNIQTIDTAIYDHSFLVPGADDTRSGTQSTQPNFTPGKKLGWSPTSAQVMGPLSPVPSGKACSLERANKLAENLLAQQVCVGPCHCAFTATRFLDYIGCDNPIGGNADNTMYAFFVHGWTATRITDVNRNNLPLGYLWQNGHVGVSIGNGRLFDSAGKPNRKYMQQKGCLWLNKDSRGTDSCNYCNKVLGHGPETTRYAAGGGGADGCSGNQIWAIRPLDKRSAFKFVLHPKTGAPHEKLGCCNRISAEGKSSSRRVTTLDFCRFVANENVRGKKEMKMLWQPGVTNTDVPLTKEQEKYIAKGKTKKSRRARKASALSKNKDPNICWGHSSRCDGCKPKVKSSQFQL